MLLIVPAVRRFKLASPIKLFCAFALLANLLLLTPGCSTPSIPSVTGTNMFHDIAQVRKGMSPNEVRRVMGGNYTNTMEEGIRGMDGGNYTWVYAEGRVNFNINGVSSTEPN